MQLLSVYQRFSPSLSTLLQVSAVSLQVSAAPPQVTALLLQVSAAEVTGLPLQVLAASPLKVPARSHAQLLLSKSQHTPPSVSSFSPSLSSHVCGYDIEEESHRNENA